MRVLVLCDYPFAPGGLSTQAALLCRGLEVIGVEVRAVHWQSDEEKEWYYRWFRPDVAIGVGYWGYTPQLIVHPQQFGIRAVPWLVADGYMANYREVLSNLPLVLATSNWVKEVYVRDGLREEVIEVLPVGCNTDLFFPRDPADPRVVAIRDSFGVGLDCCLILTVGGDAASKGAQEVMQGLAMIAGQAPPWKYLCKVWPQPRTEEQTRRDLHLARELGIERQVVFAAHVVSRNYMPYLMAACDIYAAPSRLEGFGMPHVEAGACGKPVVGIKAMALLDTLVHGETAFLAGVAREKRITETTLGPESGFELGHRVVFDPPRIADYRADSGEVGQYLLRLLRDPGLRQAMGAAGRKRVVEQFDYRLVARRLVDILSDRLGIR